MKKAVQNSRRRSLAPVAVAGAIALAAPANAQYRMDLPPDGPPITNVNPQITARPNALLPLDLPFTSSDGKKLTLDELFHHGRPVIILMVYHSCPQMCGLNQDSLAETVREGPRGLKLGNDFDVIVVSIDPDDTPEIAAGKREKYLGLMDRTTSQSGFTYLTGTESNIKTLAQAIGFGYYRNPPGGTDKFAHSLGQFIITPDGHVSRTLGNLVSQSYTPDEMHAALLLAADGKIGSSTFNFLLKCGAMRLNPLTGKYENNPWFYAGVAGGLASMGFMGLFLGVLWRGEYKKHKAAQAAAQKGPPDPPAMNLAPNP